MALQKITEGITGEQAADIIFQNDAFILGEAQKVLVGNLFENSKANLQTGFRLNSNGGGLVSNDTNPRYVTSKGVPVIAGEWYALSGDALALYLVGNIPRGSFSANPTTTSPLVAPDWVAIPNGWKVQAPLTGYFYFDVYLSPSLTSLNGTLMVVRGETAADYVPFGEEVINPAYLPDEDILDELKDAGILVEYSFNLINPDAVDFARRYSPASTGLVARGATVFALSEFIPVEEGQWYTLHTEADNLSGYQGGFFASEADTAAIQSITMVEPVTGLGRCFQVPTGLGIVGVRVNIVCQGNPPNNTLLGNWQLERGEMATPYQPYAVTTKINPAYLPDDGGGSAAPSSELDKYLTFGNLSYQLGGKLPKFKQHWAAKDKDVVVVNTGTSLTARTVEHCTEHPDAATRPPLMHSMNFATHIWDALRWEGQEYRRYDSGAFTETGTFITASAADEWDDGPYRNGLTRYADGAAASVSFNIPITAWQFNFIHRLDSVGTLAAAVAVSGGNGLVQVYDEVADAWVEANGFIFSQRNPPIEVLPSITFTNPVTGVVTTSSNYAVSGNTTYQKRLKFRCRNGAGLDSTAVEKTVTISKTAGRLLYWGVEWTPREFMVSYINAARGSNGLSITGAATSLTHYQDNEVWGFKPDLILTENAIHNSGGGGAPNVSYPSSYWGVVTDNFFFADNGVSMQARAETLGITGLEWVIFNSSITWNFGGIDDDGKLKVTINQDGRALTALDAQMLSNAALAESKPDAVIIQAVKHFVDAAVASYGNLRSATEGSGKAGRTFTNEGSHWNNTGSRIMARAVLPILDLYY